MTVQHLVEDLASRIGRPVLLEDHGQRVIAYSDQTGPMDDIRRDSILHRQTSPEVRQRFRSAGIFESRGPLRIPAEPGMLARVCVPARHRDRLLGFVWLIDAEPPVADADVVVTEKTADAMALALLHDDLAAGLDTRRELAAVSDVLLGQPDEADAGARLLVEAGGFPARTPVVVLVVRGADPLEPGLLAARGRLVARHLLRYDHGVLLCAGRPDPAEVHATFASPVVIGVGRLRPSLSEAGLSYREARHAAVVAARVPGYGPTAEWDSLGVYGMLTPQSGELHPGVELLLADHQTSLLETLETYLDLAGNVGAAAKVLRLHRTSMYYRLQRVEELAGVSLKNGNERLTLHLSIKLARLSGRF